MRINNITRNNPTFNGAWNNKVILKTLEKISEHGTSFSAGVSLMMSLTLRPLAIMSTPDTEKENKQYACSYSIGSGLAKFGLVEAIAIPLENAVKKIDANPEKYIKPSAIKNLKQNSALLAEADAYRFGTQIIKLGAGFISAVPKSILTVAFIPIIMDKLFNFKNYKNKTDLSPQNDKISFQGGLTKNLGRIFNNKQVQNFLIKNQSKEKDIAKHITAATDILLTATGVYQTQKSKNIKDNRKKALIYNNIISTIITLGGGYGFDSLLKKHSTKFIDKFSKMNAGDIKLHKYIDGINILRPALIFAAIYYGILPIFSTYISEKIDKHLS